MADPDDKRRLHETETRPAGQRDTVVDWRSWRRASAADSGPAAEHAGAAEDADENNLLIDELGAAVMADFGPLVAAEGAQAGPAQGAAQAAAQAAAEGAERTVTKPVTDAALAALLPLIGDVDEQTKATAPATASRTFRPGSKVGRYEILGTIGRGGMGVIYEARDPELSRNVALKLVQVTAKQREKLANRRARLMREATAMAQLSHPNVVAVYDVGHFGEHVFVAMELVRGLTVSDWLHERSRSVSEIVAVFVAAGRGLAAAHRAGLVHRDFKPTNIMVDGTGRVRVLDFGLVRVADQAEQIELLRQSIRANMDDDDDDDTKTSVSTDRALAALWPRARQLADALTATGAVVGTPAYMAPEQYIGGPVDARTDQFAFCVALYQALYKKRPFAGLQAVEIRDRVFAGDIEPPPADTEVPPSLHAVLVRGMATHSGDRFPSMEALLVALQAAVEPSRRVGLFVAALVAAGLVLAFGGWATLLIVQGDGASARGPSPAEIESVCGELAVARGETWTPERQRAVARRFASSERAHASATGERVRAMLDAYEATWGQVYGDICGDRAGSTGAASAPAVVCLRDRLRALDALITPLAVPPHGSPEAPGAGPQGGADDAGGELSAGASAADEIMIDRAIQAAQDLPAVESCRGLAGVAPLAVATPLVSRDEALAVSIAQARGDFQLGRTEGLAQLVAVLAERADERADAALRARAHLLLGRIRADAGEFDAADTSLRQAAARAVEAGDASLAATAWLTRIDTLSASPKRHEDALAMLPRVEQAVERAGNSPPLRARLLATTGQMLARGGDLAMARDAHERGLSAAMVAYGVGGIGTSAHRVWLAEIATLLADYDVAANHYERALAIYRVAYGAKHVLLAGLVAERGDLERVRGQCGAARDRYREARAIEVENRGERSALTIAIDHALARCLLADGRYPAAREALTRALAVATAAALVGPAELAAMHVTEAELMIARGQLEPARALLQDSAATLLDAYGARDERYLTARAALGTARARLGQPEGVEILAEVLAARIDLAGLDHPAAIAVERDLGAALVALGRYDQARGHLERAQVASANLTDERPLIDASIAAEYGWLWLASGDPEQARAALAEALTGGGDALPRAHPLRARITAGKGLAELASARPEAATAPLTRALAIWRDVGADPLWIGQARFGLAQATWQRRPRRQRQKQAVRIARTARAELVAAGDRASAALAEVDAWLASRAR